MQNNNPTKENYLHYFLLLLFCIYSGFILVQYYLLYPFSQYLHLDRISFSGKLENFTPFLRLLIENIFYLTGFCICAVGLGKKTGLFLNIEEEKINPLVGFGIGSILIGCLLLAFGMIGLFNKYIPIILILLGMIYFRDIWRKNSLSKCFDNKKINFPDTLTCLLLALSFLISTTPITESDALRYHASLPATMIQNKGIFYYTYNSFFQFPALIEMIFTFVGITGAKMVHWFYFLLTILLLRKIIREYYPGVKEEWVSVIYASTPFVPILSGWPFIEGAMTFYILLATYLLLKISKKDLDYRGIILLGIILGGLVGMKYSMIPFIIIYGLILLGIYWKQNKVRLGKGILLLVLSILLVAAPWYIKSFIYTGNPVYPMGYSILGGDYWNEGNAKFYLFHAQSKGGLWNAQQENILYRGAELFILPVKATLNPPSFAVPNIKDTFWLFGLYQVTESKIFLPYNFGDWQLGPIFLIFLPLVLLYLYRRFKEKPEEFYSVELILLLITGWYYLLWSQSYRDNRFLMPILPLLAIFIGITIHWLEKNWVKVYTGGAIGVFIRRLGKRSIKIFLGGILIYNSLWIMQTTLREHNPLPYITGELSKDEYLARKLDYYPTYQKLNSINVNEQPILNIGEYRPYYLKSTNYTADYFDTPVILRIIEGANSPEEIQNRMAEMKIGYIFYNESELSRYLPDFQRHFYSEEQWTLYTEFIRHIRENAQEKIPINRPLSEYESSRIQRFYTNPQLDPRFIYIFKI